MLGIDKTVSPQEEDQLLQKAKEYERELEYKLNNYTAMSGVEYNDLKQALENAFISRVLFMEHYNQTAVAKKYNINRGTVRKLINQAKLREL